MEKGENGGWHFGRSFVGLHWYGTGEEALKSPSATMVADFLKDFWILILRKFHSRYQEAPV